MGLREKLEQLESLRPVQPDERPRTPQVAPPFPRPAPGRGEDPASSFYRERDFPLEHRHGRARLDAILARSSKLYALVGKSQILGDVTADQLLFIDTETSGLSGGAGTFAFLVGIGYFTERSFRVVQFFMSDLDEESPLLNAVSELVARHHTVVSYNGKCFDIPLLNSRSVYHRLRSPFEALRHLDLLHAIRRLWRHRLPDCSLSSAEQAILGVQRVGDVPGYLIPHLYFDYLQHKNARTLDAVFYHNQQDVLSMVGLLDHLLGSFEQPQKGKTSLSQVLAMGQTHEHLNQVPEAIALYEAFLPVYPSSFELRFRLGFGYKKLGEWAKAADVWHACLETGRFHPLPYIELAKYYEHRTRDLETARRLVRKALSELDVLLALERDHKWFRYLEDLQHRQRRLERKAKPR